MDRTSIEQAIRTFIIDQFLAGHAEELQTNESLLGTVIDSTGILVLVTYLQDRFAITVEDDDVVPENIDSVANLVAYVARKLQNKV